MFRRTKKFLKDNEGPIAFGAGIFVGGCAVAAYPKFFIDPLAFYNSKQPIPDLLVDEGTIKAELVAGFLASDFLKQRDLMDQFAEFAAMTVTKSLDIRNQMPK